MNRNVLRIWQVEGTIPLATRARGEIVAVVHKGDTISFWRAE